MAILDYGVGLQNAPNPVAGGMQAAGQMQGLMQNKQMFNQQQQQLQQEQEVQAQQQAALQEASNLMLGDDYSAQAQFMVKNPKMREQFIGAMKFKDGQAMAERIDFNKKILSGSADPRPMLEERIKLVASKGGDTENLEATLALGSDDEIRSEIRKELSFLDSEALLNAEAAQAGGAPMTDYQKAMIEGRKLDREISQLKIEQANAKNQLQEDKLSLEIDEKQAKVNKIEKDNAREEIDLDFQVQAIEDEGLSVLNLVNEIKNHQGFSDLVGAQSWQAGFGLLDPIKGTPAADVKAMIDTLEAKGFLTAVGQFKEKGGGGSLSDSEGKSLSASITNLSEAQSENGFMRSLNEIERLVKLGIDRSKQKREAKKSVTGVNSMPENKVFADKMKNLNWTTPNINQAMNIINQLIDAGATEKEINQALGL